MDLHDFYRRNPAAKLYQKLQIQNSKAKSFVKTDIYGDEIVFEALFTQTETGD